MALTQDVAAFELRSVSRTHPGHRRALNEDRLLDRPEDGLWAVADGMGGHRAGDVAAARVVEALAAIEHGASGYTRVSDIVREMEAINASLFGGERDLLGMPSGSTLVALLAHEGHYACLWAGDSRAYLRRNGRLVPITRDHSLVQQMIDGGALSEGDRRSHPSAHIITRAVGTAASIEFDRQFGTIVSGDLFLLCSDGLTACLDDAQMAQALEHRDLAHAADALLAAALAGDAPDNVSFVLIGAEGASRPLQAQRGLSEA